MKKIIIVLTVAALSAMFLCPNSLAQKKKKNEDPQLAEAVVNAVKERNFRIQMISATARSGEVIDASKYDMVVRNGRASTRLPYFGSGGATSAYGSDGDTSIVLEDYPVTLKVDESKADKGRYVVRFESRSGSENVTFLLRIFTNGTVDISVQPTSRVSMTYYGYLTF